jgi:hypothetical protein
MLAAGDGHVASQWASRQPRSLDEATCSRSSSGRLVISMYYSGHEPTAAPGFAGFSDAAATRVRRLFLGSAGGQELTAATGLEQTTQAFAGWRPPRLSQRRPFLNGLPGRVHPAMLPLQER